MLESEEMKRYIDVESALKRMMNNKNLYKKLLRSFLDNGYANILCAKVDSGDIGAAIDTAHAVKGLCANLSLPALYNASVELETALKNGNGFEAPYEHFNSDLGETIKAINTVLEEE